MSHDGNLGVELANRLGLSGLKRQGKELVGPCPACPSSDAFNLNAQEGVSHCFSCNRAWSPLQLAEEVLRDRDAAKQAMIDLGVFEKNRNGRAAPADPLETIARQKSVPRDSLVAYGAVEVRSDAIQLPAYGPDGEQCSTCTLKTANSKGLFAKGTKAGLFFPHSDGKVQLPQSGETWLVAEGPKDAAALHGLGYLACGLNTNRLAAKFARLFRGVHIVLVPDRDRAGVEGAKQSAAVLRGVAASVLTAVLPAEFSENKGADVRDVLRRLDGEGLVRQAVKDALPAFDESSDDDDYRSKPESQSTIAIKLTADWEAWRTPSGEAYVTVPVDEHFETLAVKSKRLKNLLARRFFESEGKAINSETSASTIALLDARASFEGDVHRVHVRVAEHEGAYYLDLGDETWRAVRITPDGWEIVDQAPVRFRRSMGMLALPEPQRGGSVELLRDFLNVDESTWKLVVAWLLAALRPAGSFPLLALFAEQGSGKSTTARILRSLVDPNAAPLRAESRNSHELMIAAKNSWMIAFDNLSYVPPWLSDALCRMSTGGGFATRELYSDDDEVIFEAVRPIMLTSIEEVASRSDLLDRCAIAWLPAIPVERRRSEREILEEFEAVRSQILGALLDAVSGAMRELPNVQLDRLPRMADFAIWGTAAERALGWEEGSFLAAYEKNRESANDLAIEACPVGQTLVNLLVSRGGWEGPAAALLDALREFASDEAVRARSWPKNASSLGRQLTRLAPNLRQAGWAIEQHRNGGNRTWSIQPRGDAPIRPIRSEAPVCAPLDNFEEEWA